MNFSNLSSAAALAKVVGLGGNNELRYRYLKPIYGTVYEIEPGIVYRSRETNGCYTFFFFDPEFEQRVTCSSAQVRALFVKLQEEEVSLNGILSSYATHSTNIDGYRQGQLA